MGPKKGKESKNSRRWTLTELSSFAEVLADLIMRVRLVCAPELQPLRIAR